MADPILLDFENEAPVERVWVFLSRDAKGREGILSAGFGSGPGTQHLPLITGNERHLPNLEKLARMIAGRATDKTVVLVEYSNRRDVRVVKP